MAEADDLPEGGRKGMDPLKAYCLVLGFLVLVLAFLWFKIRSERDDYASANLRAEQFLSGKGLARAPDAPPPAIPDLAYEVERFVETYKATAGEGGSVAGIPLEMMKNYASAVGMVQESAGSENVDTNKQARYETRSRDFDYKPTTVNRLLLLAYNVESKGRYKVSEITWRLADPKDNAAAPFWNIAKPRIKVGVRTPIAGSSGD